MRVMCIRKDKPAYDHPALIKAVEDIQIGSEYNVVYKNATEYELAEFPHPWRILWDRSCFAILPDQTADEMQEQEKEAILL